MVNFSERTSFGAVKTLSALCSFKNVLFFEQNISVLSETYFTFFLAKSAIAELCAFALAFYTIKSRSPS